MRQMFHRVALGIAVVLLPARVPADGVSQRSIILFRDQHPAAAATKATATLRAEPLDAQSGEVASALARGGARDVRRFHLVNAMVATISADQAADLRARDDVLAVVPDLPLGRPKREARDAGAPGAAAVPAVMATQQVCPPNPADPLLEPEALQLMNVAFQDDALPGASDLADGSGVTVAFLADGLDINNPDFTRNGNSIFTDYADFTTEGPDAATNGAEAFGDASAIAAQGNQVYDLSQAVNPAHPLPPGCNVRVRGVAPGASLVALKVFGQTTQPVTSSFLQAIERAVMVDHVDVIEQSFGASPFPDPATDPIALADSAAVAAGVVVVAGSDDAGTTRTAGSPSDDAGVIAVGAATSFRVYRQATQAGSQLSSGGWLSENISGLSSSGFRQFGPHTIDMLAPGDLGWAVCTPNPSRFGSCTGFSGQPSSIQAFGGTSQSSALTAGVAALVIQAYAQTHGGIRPTPALVKQIIASSATDLHAPAEEQGAGLVNARKAVQLALSVPDRNGKPPKQGSHLLVDHTSLSAAGAPGKELKFHVKVTNTGDQSATLQPVLQALHPTFDSSDSGTININPASAPAFIDGRGIGSAFAIHQFTVPSGVDHLDGTLAWNGQAQPNSLVHLTLFDPSGRMAAYSNPQGGSGFAHVDVHDPASGTWSAAVWTRKNGTVYNGDVQFAFTTQHFESIGTVSPGKTLKPGARKSVSVHLPLPTDAGDTSARLVLGTGGPDDGIVPITVRSLVPVSKTGATFHGLLTGGNGRKPFFGGQVLSFQFDVPKGVPVVNLALQLANPNDDLIGFLLDPQNQPLDIQSTVPIGGGSFAFTDTMQFSLRTPQAGRWTLVLALGLDNSGRLQESFTGTIDFTPASITVDNLPTSKSAHLTAGQPVAVTVHVTNTGVSQKVVFVDARLTQLVTVPVLALSPTTVPLPLGNSGSRPTWLVPTHADALTMVASSTVPIAMTMSDQFGASEVPAVARGSTATANLALPAIAPGVWFGAPALVGPFGNGGPPAATADMAATAEMNVFDRAITSDTGDLWLLAVDSSAPPFSPLVLDPGQSSTIAVTITPAGPAGTSVKGFLEVSTINPNTISGDTLAAFPYAYRIQ
jgi:hypothetical protein